CHDVRRRAAGGERGARGRARDRGARVPGSGAPRGAMARDSTRGAGDTPPSGAGRAGPGADVGDRADGAGGALRGPRPGARLAGGHRRSHRAAPAPAARGHTRRAGARRGDPRKRARVSAVSLRVVREAPAPTVRPATLADVPQLETLMAPYVASGDLLPRSNYDLCRHIKEYVVAPIPDVGIIGCASFKVTHRLI